MVGLTALAALAAWQFYLFATFKDASGTVDLQGGTLHLWLALGIAVVVFVGGFFFLSRLLQNDQRNNTHINSPGQQAGPVGFRRDSL
jgi:hypothetical protein